MSDDCCGMVHPWFVVESACSPLGYRARASALTTRAAEVAWMALRGSVCADLDSDPECIKVHPCIVYIDERQLCRLEKIQYMPIKVDK